MIKNSLTVFSGIFHPVFIPLFAIILFVFLDEPPHEEAYVLTQKWVLYLSWISMTLYIVPLVYLTKIKENFNLVYPNSEERRTLYRFFLLLHFLVALPFLMLDTRVSLVFGCYMLLFLCLWRLNTIKLKASWHAAGWFHFLTSLVLIWAKYQDPTLKSIIIAVLSITILVVLARKALNAHTWFELIIGASIGILVSLPILIL